MKKIINYVFITLMLFTLTACGKAPLESSQIEKTLREKGFSINDLTNTVEDTYIDEIKGISNKRLNFEYYVFKTDKAAKEAYDNNVKAFNEDKKAKSKEKSRGDFERYIQKTDKFYNVVVRNEMTVVYVSVNIDNKKEVNKILKEIGYY